MMGNVVLADGRSKLILHAELLLRSRNGKSASPLKLEGFQRSLGMLSSAGLSVVSLTTNGSPLVNPLKKKIEENVETIRHFSPGCHLLKWFECELEKAANHHGCEEIGAWHKRITKFLWRTIEHGINYDLKVPPMFNTCLMHVRGVHKWPQEELTGPYTKCYHDPVSRPCHESLMLEGKAFKRFQNVVLTESFQKDLPDVSPFGDTVIYDIQKAMDSPLSVYPLCSLMATMHVNAWRMAETKRRRNFIKKRARYKRLAKNSPTKHTWRKSIFDEVLKERLLALEKSQKEESTSEYVRELMIADEYYENEL
ncbi:hypothetical protein COOONC_08157 [Cooperia oncophora]